jgi:ferric-dicitrate binding protein FerR (iron transport regulator)
MYPEEVRNYIAGNYSAADKEFVKEWVKEDPAREKELQELKRVWQLTSDLELTDEDEVEQAWSVVSSKMNQLRAVKPLELSSHSRGHDRSKNDDGWKVFLKVAVVLLVATGMFAVYNYQDTEPKKVVTEEQVYESTVRAEYGEQVRFRMRDGTVVTLNAGSKIRHDNQFAEENRELYLTGEAYFEVNNKGQKHPFVVKTDDARVKDIGTKFNINAYEEKETTEVVVSEGEVQVSPQVEASTQPSKVVSVKQGKMVNVSRASDQLVVKEANINQALGWLNKKLIFDNERFEDIVKRLERYYNIDITIKDDSLEKKIVKASFNNERVEKVMSVLAISLGANYEIKGDSISFRSEDQF